VIKIQKVKALAAEKEAVHNSVINLNNRLIVVDEAVGIIYNKTVVVEERMDAVERTQYEAQIQTLSIIERIAALENRTAEIVAPTPVLSYCTMFNDNDTITLKCKNFP
jgi:hypothetical protein